ncbi:MAG: hypothetical protein J6C37_08480 [Roseburia sp.]|nr:hypothetical protein [Roseburia sp.]
MSNTRRRIEELSLIDDFMFTEASVDQKTAQILVGMIITRATGLKVGKLVIEAQKTVNGVDTDCHGVRLDVAVHEVETEEGKTVQLFDIEPNNIQTDNLPKRSRYYQALTDVKVLESGIDYDKIPNLWMIWILPYDPFEKDYMMYSVKNRVEEFPEIEYNDGVRKLFLYTGGTKGGTESLRDLLVYIQNSKAENAVDEELKELHSNVERLKSKKEIGVKYMRMQDVIEYKIKTAVEANTIEVTQKVTENVEQQMAELAKILVNANRMEDLQRMADDKDYRKKLLAEFDMA